MHEADLEQQRQARRKIVTSNETLGNCQQSFGLT